MEQSWTRAVLVRNSLGTLVLGHWSWDIGLGTVVLGHWSWDSGLGTVVLGQWSWDSGLGILVLGRWYWAIGLGTVVLGHWSWAIRLGTLVLGQWSWDVGESLSKLGDAKFFTTLDLGSAFWQVPLRKQDRDKTGFACELGLFQWKRMPFGLCNATATFQRLMAHALIGVTKKYGNLVICYVDDVVVATPTLEDHIERLDEVFACMRRSGLKCKPSKCEILKDSIKYLGRMVDKHGIRPDPDAVETVLTWKSPKTEHQLMSFLGFANYYREFVKGYADKVYPMQQLMRHKGKKFTWNNAAEESFQRIKKELCEAPVLGMPTEKGMYVLDTDASVVATSGILHQEQEWNGKTVLRPIAYGSKVLSDTEMKYGAPKAEMFAVVTFVEKYRAYLGSEPFKLRVDNRALSWLKTYSMDQSYIGRWIVRLDRYNMIIEHRTRDKHQNADSLSKKTEFYERQEQREADRPEIKDGFSFMDKETYDSLPLTRWLDKSGKPIEDHPELPKETTKKNNLEKEPRDADRNNAQVKDREGDAQSKRLRSQPSRNGGSTNRRRLKGVTRETSR